MHLPESLLVIACGFLLPLTCAWAEAASDRAAPEQSQSRGPQERPDPYHVHHDRRAAGSAGGRLLAVPRSAKPPDEQERDHYDCYRFAVAQSGFDPMRTNPPSVQATGRVDYERAQAACFEARGYTVR